MSDRFILQVNVEWIYLPSTMGGDKSSSAGVYFGRGRGRGRGRVRVR